MIRAFFILLLFASSAHARTWQVDIIQSHGLREITRQDAIAMAHVMRAKFASIGIKIRIGRVSYTKLINPDYTLATYTSGVFWWQKRLPPRANIIRHVITPPFFDGKLFYIAGVAPGVCLARWKYAVSTSNAQRTNLAGQDRFWHSAIAMTHELGHVFGCRHTVSRSIMNVGALSLEPVATLQFAPESTRQIYQCIG